MRTPAWRGRGSRRIAGALVACIAGGLAVSAGAAPALASALPDVPIPVRVAFAGSGSFTYDNSEGSVAHADDALSWDVEYESQLQPDGTLSVATATPPATAGNYGFTDSFYGVSCSGPISTEPQAGPFPAGTPNPPPESTPSPKAEGTLVQSITYLSADPARFGSCVGTLEGYEGGGEAAAGVGEVLDGYLPGALTARIAAVPRAAFLAGGVALRTEAVSYGSAPTQLPASCAEAFGIADPAKCTVGLSWSGTVLLDATAGCPVILGPPPVCMPPTGTPVSAFTSGVETEASGPGTVSLSATSATAHGASAGAARTVVVTSASAKAARAGRVRLKPKLTAAGRRLLRRSKRLRVSVRIVFRPRAGASKTTRFATVLSRR